MLSQQTIDRLNEQINLEIYSSHLYLEMNNTSLNCIQPSHSGNLWEMLMVEEMLCESMKYYRLL